MLRLLDSEFRKRPMAIVGLFLLLVAVIRLGVFLPGFYRDALPDIRDTAIQGTIYKIEEKANSTACYIKTEEKIRIIVYFTHESKITGNGNDQINTASKEEKKIIGIKNDQITAFYLDEFKTTGSGNHEVSDSEDKLHIGNTIRVTGDYTEYKKPGNPGEFNSRQYYAAQKIHGSMYGERIEIIENKISIIPEIFRNIRYRIRERIQSIYPDPYAGIITAMLVGDRSIMDEDIRELYSSCGIAHIIAISGLHISFFADIVKRILRKLLGFKWGTVSSVFVIFIYVLITGVPASALRAFLFFLIMMTGELMGRGSDMPTACFLSFGLMLTLRPMYLLDSGFVLSYAAVSGVVILSRLLLYKDPMDKYTGNVTDKAFPSRDDSLIDVSFKDVTFKDVTFKNVTFKDVSFKDVYYKDDSFKDVSFKNDSFKDISFKDVYYKNDSFKDVSYIDLSIQNTSLRHSFLDVRRIFTMYINELRSVLKLGILMQLTTLPLLLFFYYTYCPYGFFLNLIVIPAMPIVLSCGAVSIILSMVGSLLSGILSLSFFSFLSNIFSMEAVLSSFPAVIVLKGYEAICNFTSRLPLGIIVIGKPKIWQMIVYYLILVLILAEYRLRTNPDPNRKQGEIDNLVHKYKNRGIYGNLIRILVTVNIGLFAVFILTVKPVDEFRLSFLDVGQGDCIYFETEDAFRCICDCGSSSRSHLAEYVLVPYLKSRGIDKVDAVFITHGDSDHYNGIYELLEDPDTMGITITNLVITSELSKTEIGIKLMNLAKERSISVYSMNAGQKIQAGKLEILCLYPEITCDSSGDDNNASMVLKLKYRDFDALLCGDLELAGEMELVNNIKYVNEPSSLYFADNINDSSSMNNNSTYNQTSLFTESISSDLIKIGHHGSSGSTGGIFLEMVKPTFAVISYGFNNPYGHPHTETIDKLRADGIAIYETAPNGEISFSINRKKIKIKTYR